MVYDRKKAVDRATASTTNGVGMCQYWTRTIFGAVSVGDFDGDGLADAEDGWKSEPTKARHPGDRNPPAGVPVSYSGGSKDAGHRAVSLGNGKIRSTDAGGNGLVATVALDWPEKHWGLKYLGWSETIDGVPIPLNSAPSKPQSKPTGTVFGIDISHFQDKLDLSLPIKQGYSFLIVKCTQGSTFLDPNYSKAIARGKLLGYALAVYHFLEKGNGVAQARWLAKNIGDKTLPVFIDVEKNPANDKKPTMQDWVDFRNEATKLGLNVQMKYLSESYWLSIGKPSLAGPLKLWVAGYPSSRKDYGSKLYPGNDHSRWDAFGGQTPTIWQFASTGKIDGYSGSVDVNAFRGTRAELVKSGLFKDFGTAKPPVSVTHTRWTTAETGVFDAPAGKLLRTLDAGYRFSVVSSSVGANGDWVETSSGNWVALSKTTTDSTPIVVTDPEKTFGVRLFLVPGNKTQTAASIENDMAKVLTRAYGSSNIVGNTERESDASRKAVADGLGVGWTQLFENENVAAVESDWHQAPKHSAPKAILLAKDDPSMSGVSPRRYLDEAFLENDNALGVSIAVLFTHLVSEANCIHKDVKGRAWREKTWKIQVNDVLNEVERLNKLGLPVFLEGDFNTGVYFTGKQLFDLFVKRFGKHAVHIHNGGLDQVILVSTDEVTLVERGTETIVPNASDHDMVVSVIDVVVN